MFINSFSFIALLIIFSFIYILKTEKQYRYLVISLMNILVYSIISADHLPALFLFLAVSYIFTFLVYKPLSQSRGFFFVAIFTILCLALFILIKTIPNLEIRENLAIRLLAPLGFSYIALQNIGFLISVRRQEILEFPNPIEFIACSSFFAILVSGPITKLVELKKQIEQSDVTKEDYQIGLIRIINGFFKKTLSDILITPLLFPNNPNILFEGHLYVVPGLLFKFYMDFSGYTDIAVGSARLLGIRLPENFDSPYVSRTISEYWNRWHMSLGAWFKEYFFFPLQLYWMRQLRSSFQQLLFVNLTLFATFILIGLWHGISAKYLLWGVLNASFVLTSPLLLTLRERFHQRSVDVLLICLTLLITFVGQLLLMSHGINGFTRNLTDTFHPDKISGSDISIFFVLSILLSLQHVYDSYSRRLDYHGGQIKFVAIALQLMVVTMLHSSGVGFLYAEF